MAHKLTLHSQQVRCSNPCNAFQYCHEYNVQINMVSVKILMVQNIDDLHYSDINFVNVYQIHDIIEELLVI